ncbi:MAG: hypothetical protein ACQEW7_02315, partial [Pseudomonadota bacterium]
MIDHAGGKISGGFGGEVYAAAVGFNGAALFDVGVQLGLFHFNLDRAAHVQGDTAARAHQHVAARGGDAAFVDDFGGNQGNIAFIGCADVALVDNGAAAVAFEGEVA